MLHTFFAATVVTSVLFALVFARGGNSITITAVYTRENKFAYPKLHYGLGNGNYTVCGICIRRAYVSSSHINDSSQHQKGVDLQHDM